MYFANQPFYVSIDPMLKDSDLPNGVAKDRKYLALGTSYDGLSLMLIGENRRLLYLPLHYVLFEGFKTKQPNANPLEKKSPEKKSEPKTVKEKSKGK